MKRIHFDIDTQFDFLAAAGALAVPGAAALLPRLARLNASAPLVVSTMCAHTEDDAEFRQWPPHCVLGTLGQRKPAALLVEPRVTLPPDITPLPDLGGARQILLEKRALDLFTNPNLEALLAALGADEYAVYGVVTEYCVRLAAMGLLRTGKPVHLVTDAIQTLDREDGERAVAEFHAAGGKLTTAAALLASVQI
ncbi:MAG: isochorismatase family protein [Bryobacterales bacterium]|nr:isochorismatase family protein [Bryobacterales bacterium]